MPQLKFSAQFAAAVSSGTKRQTIRAMRKNPIREHDVLHLFTGLRTKNARRLLPPRFCTSARLITMKRTARAEADLYQIELDHHGMLSGDEICEMATKDGFSSVSAFLEWFLPKGTDEFKGQLITW